MTIDELDEDLIRAHNKMTEAIEQGTETYGMRSSLARVYCYLFLSSEPHTFKELVAATGDSKPIVNDAIHGLKQLQLIKDTTHPSGDTAFTTTKSPGEVMRSTYPATNSDGIDNLLQVLNDAQSNIKTDDGKEAQIMVDRIDDLKRHLRFTKTLLNQYTTLPDEMITDAVDSTIGDNNI